MNNDSIDSKIERHPELNSLNQELELIDLAVNNHARPHGYIEAGEALKKAQEQQIFKHLYNSFDEFCFNRYQFQVEQGYKLIRASDVANLIKNKGFCILPEIESHARCFTKLLRQNQSDIITAVWLELTSSSESITAKRIKDFIYKYSKNSSASFISTNPPKKEISLNNQISIDLQRELEKNQPLHQASNRPKHQNTEPIHQLPRPINQRIEESQLVEELTDQLAEEKEINRELRNMCLNLTNDLKRAINALANKDLINEQQNDEINQWRDYANTIEEQKKFNFSEYLKAIGHAANRANVAEEQVRINSLNWNNTLNLWISRCNQLQQQLNNQNNPRNINTIDIQSKNI